MAALAVTMLQEAVVVLVELAQTELLGVEAPADQEFVILSCLELLVAVVLVAKTAAEIKIH